jgi:hypothetical protein
MKNNSLYSGVYTLRDVGVGNMGEYDKRTFRLC